MINRLTSRFIGVEGMGDKGSRSRRRIVEAARALFHARGYANTSMDDIVREAGIKSE